MALVFVGLPLFALWSVVPQMRRDVGHDAIPLHWRATLWLLGALAAVMPVVAVVTLRRTQRLCAAPQGITLGGRYAAWTDISAVSWRGGSGANVLLLHLTRGQPLRVIPSVYSGGEAMVFALLGEHLSPDLLAPALREMQEAE